MEMVSVIRESLWHKAGWSGTLFLTNLDEEQPSPPALAPMFREAGPAGEIFTQWRSEIGAEDAHEILRVVIVRGISRKKPHSYRVVIGANPRAAMKEDHQKLVFMISRVNTMTPSSGENLERFLRSYNNIGAYALIHGIMLGDPVDATPVWDNSILKKELIVREAWQIGINDPDQVGILEDDDPVIPPDQKNAPVLELLQSKRERRKQATRASGKTGSLSPQQLSPKARAERRKADRRRAKRAAKKKKRN